MVDFVGLTVLGDARWDAELGFDTPTYDCILRPRYGAVEATRKPIIISELGVSGTAADQAAWLVDGAHGLEEFPSVVAAVYFHERNAANNWRVTQPDWRLKDPGALEAFLNARAAS